jgi:hypothetical protein
VLTCRSAVEGGHLPGGGPAVDCRVPADWLRDLQHLPGTPWSLRLAGAPDGRHALEVYDAGVLVDVMVARTLAPRILRGARSAVWAGEHRAVAWGSLPPGGAGGQAGAGGGLRADVACAGQAGAPLQVAFRRGRVRPRLRLAEVATIAGCFWIALASGRFGHVQVTDRDTRHRAGLRTARPS